MSGANRALAIELCVESVEGAAAAERFGLDRIEVCADLAEGGITPSIGLIAEILQRAERIGVQVLIRPRPGHFVYDEEEIRVMETDIAAISALERSPRVRVGFVLGALDPAGQVDSPALTRLLAACGPAPVTFHRCFDLTGDLRSSLDTLARLRVARVLTSGGAATAVDGTSQLRQLVRHAGTAVTVLAGGGIRAHNLARVVTRGGVREVHFSARRPVDPLTTGPGISPAETLFPSGTLARLDEPAIRDLVTAACRLTGRTDMTPVR